MRNSFVMHDAVMTLIRSMDAENRAMLILAIAEYVQDGHTNTDLSAYPVAKCTFDLFSKDFAEDSKKYDETIKARSEAGKSSGRRRANPQKSDVDVASVPFAEQNGTNLTSVNFVEQTSTNGTNANTCEQVETKRTDYVNDYVCDYVSDSDYESDSVGVNDLEGLKEQKDQKRKTPTVSKEKSTRFVPPTVDEVAEYCAERGNSVNAEQFVDFYASKGWKVGKNPMKDWKASVRTWERNGRDSPRRNNDGMTYLEKVIRGEIREEDVFNDSF